VSPLVPAEGGEPRESCGPPRHRAPPIASSRSAPGSQPVTAATTASGAEDDERRRVFLHRMTYPIIKARRIRGMSHQPGVDFLSLRLGCLKSRHDQYDGHGDDASIDEGDHAHTPKNLAIGFA